MLIGIFGTGRNGSTLIGQLLDGLEGTYIHPVEERFLTVFDDLARCGRVTRLIDQNCTTRALKNLDDRLDVDLLANYYQISLKELLKHCSGVIESPSSLKKLELAEVVSGKFLKAEEFTREYLSGIANKVRPELGFKHHVFKSIEVAYLREYENRFPQMKFVHIIRDPIAVCSSQKRSLIENKCLPASYLGYDWLDCMVNKRWLPHARFLADLRNHESHIIIRYEDLVSSPVAEISRVATFLQLASPQRPKSQTIFYNLDKEKWQGNPSKKGVDTPTEVVADLQDLNRYDEVLTSREIDQITVLTREFLPIFGYTSLSNATLSDVRRQYMWPDKWEFIHSSRSMRLLVRSLIGIVYRRIALFKKFQ